MERLVLSLVHLSPCLPHFLVDLLPAAFFLEPPAFLELAFLPLFFEVFDGPLEWEAELPDAWTGEALAAFLMFFDLVTFLVALLPPFDALLDLFATCPFAIQKWN